MNSTSTEIKVSEIKPYANNPRKNEKAIDKVADSIREFGFTQPVVLDRDYVLIIGHTRYEAAKRLGMETIPAILRPDLKPEQVTALRIADNKLGELADWDFEKLEIEIQALQERGFDFEITGFTVEEFERTRAQRIKEGLRDADEPETEPSEPVTVEPGDLFTMGTHRLLCGDAGDPAQIERLFDGRRADMIITDPPYNVAAKFSKGGRTRRFGYKPRNSAVGRPERKGKDIREKQILNDDLTAELNQDQEPEDAPPEPEPVIESEEQMIDYVFRWMLEGNSTNDILTSIIAKYPQGDAEEILKKTRARFADHSTPDGKELIGFIFEAQRKIYRDMLKIGDYGGALRALQAQHLLAERLGILKEKRNEGGFSIEGLLTDA